MYSFIPQVKRLVWQFFFAIVFIISTAEKCDSGNSGSSSDKGTDSTPKTVFYEFSDVKLLYDLTNWDYTWDSHFDDVSELHQAHQINSGTLKGYISSFRDILSYNNYPEERKPSIEFDFNLVDGPIKYVCQPNNVGDTYIEVPTYTDINTFTVCAKTIVTEKHHKQLCWSKTFNLLQSDWDYYSDRSFVKKAEIMIASYTKMIGEDNWVFARPDNGKMRIVSYYDSTVGKDFEVYSDGEITITTSTLSKPIYYNGSYSEKKWAEPQVLIVK